MDRLPDSLGGNRLAGSFALAYGGYELDGVIFDKNIELLTVEDDARNNVENYDRFYGGVYNGFFSCGLFMRKLAIDRVVKFQGELFNLATQAEWGIEDTYLGDVCYHLGLTADLYRGCRLHGCFDKKSLDRTETLIRRFRMRDKLNVKW
ncbi:MAG TPA: hypothetical protein PKW49_04285 [Paludibacteraceae bacterium]|nr:hypothetical protein [Paludibacteraceae bacterium]